MFATFSANSKQKDKFQVTKTQLGETTATIRNSQYEKKICAATFEKPLNYCDNMHPVPYK